MDAAARDARPSRGDPRRGGPDGQARRTAAADHGRRARQGAAGGRAAPGRRHLAGARSCGRRARTSRSSSARSAIASCSTGSSATRTRCRPTSPRSWRRRSRWSSSTTRSRSAFGELEHGPAVLMTKAGQVLGVLTQERPAGLLGSPAADALIVRSIGVDVGVRKGLDLVLMDERRVPLAVRSHVRPAEIGAFIDEFHPDVVAIDSPPRWAATGRPAGPSASSRRATSSRSTRRPRPTAAGTGSSTWMEVGVRGVPRGERARLPDVRRRIAEGPRHGGLPARDDRGAGRDASAEGRRRSACGASASCALRECGRTS